MNEQAMKKDADRITIPGIFSTICILILLLVCVNIQEKIFKKQVNWIPVN